MNQYLVVGIVFLVVIALLATNKKLVETLKNIYKIEELRKRVIYTIGLLLVYRLGSFVVIPGINPNALGEADALRLIFGEQEQKDWNTENIDWNAVDSQLTSQRILVTRPEINGKKLSSLRLRNNYGINISRVYRSGVQLLATPDLRLQMGDRLTVVDRKSTRLNSSHNNQSRMPSSA